MKNLFRKEVYRRRAQRLDGEVRIARPPTFVWLSALIAVIMLLSGVGLTMGDYARKETVRGVVEPEGGVIRIRPNDEGVVSEILVSEGQEVEAGQPLIRLQDDEFLPGLDALGESLRTGLVERLERLERRMEDEKRSHDIRMASLENRARATREKVIHAEARIALLGERIEINQEILERLEGLSQSGHETDLEVSQQRDSFLALAQEHRNAVTTRVDLEERLDDIQVEQDAAPIEHRREMDSLRDQRDQLQAELLRLRHRGAAELRAPLAGRMTGVTTTEGARVGPGDTLARILPEGARMRAVLYLPSRSIGTIEQGQTVQIRFDAFPYERFGVHEGRIESVDDTAILPGEIPQIETLQQGPDGRQPVYRVLVALEAQTISGYDREFPLRSGMELEADVVLERRTLIQWLFDPIYSLGKGL